MKVATVEVYVSNFGEVRLPETSVVRIKKNHWPDRRFSKGRKYEEYLLHIEKLAEREYMAGRYLKIAPPFSEWARSGA